VTNERVHVNGEVVGCVAALGFVGVPVSALVGREGVVGGGEQVEHPEVGEPRVGVGVKEDDGFPLFIAPLGIVEPRARAEGDGGELYVVRMGHRCR
jgi:hypothetical protein